LGDIGGASFSHRRQRFCHTFDASQQRPGAATNNLTLHGFFGGGWQVGLLALQRFRHTPCADKPCNAAAKSSDRLAYRAERCCDLSAPASAFKAGQHFGRRLHDAR
jgi:hypothetical protein